MNKFRSFIKPLTWSAALLLAAFVAGCGSSNNGGGAVVDPNSAAAGPIGSVSTAAGRVPLGAAGNYAILAKTAVSTIPSSVVTGNVGLSPAAKSFLTGWSKTDDVTDTYEIGRAHV